MNGSCGGIFTRYWGRSASRTSRSAIFSGCLMKWTEQKRPRTRARIVLNMVLDFAVEDGIISRNPAKSKRLKVTGKAKRRDGAVCARTNVFLAQRISMIRNEMDRAYLAIQMAHPMRLEEVHGLKWSDVDLENGLFHIRRAVTHPDRNQPEVKETKTDASRRSLAIVPMRGGNTEAWGCGSFCNRRRKASELYAGSKHVQADSEGYGLRRERHADSIPNDGSDGHLRSDEGHQAGADCRQGIPHRP